MMKGLLLGAAVAVGVGAAGTGQQTLDPYRYGLGSVQASGAISGAITEWKRLSQNDGLAFFDYASFLLAHPGWPGEAALRRSAERAMESGQWSPALATSFFRRLPPVSAVGRVRYAEALLATGQPLDAGEAARKAWVAGALSTADESRLLGAFAGSLTPADHDARMDRLLWSGATSSAQRQLALTSLARQPEFEARLALRTNASDAQERADLIDPVAGGPGLLADKAGWLRTSGAAPSARALLARPHAFALGPADAEKWYETLLSNARAAVADGDAATAFAIARQVDDAYPVGTDVSGRPYGERDDYTSLVWLAGQAALKLNRPADAVGLFERYGRASRAPQTQSKGLYWAARAADAAGQRDQAAALFVRAAGYPDQYYGQLAAERVGRALTPPPDVVARPVDPATRDAFFARETVKAAQYLGTLGAYEEQTAFVRQIALDATSDSDHVLATELSRMLSRPDLGVMIGRSALQNGLTDYAATGFPSVKVPAGQESAWTMIHAISRQESQFDRAAVSHAGARGLMQLMPGTAREVAVKMGLGFSSGQLTSDPEYNIQLGSTYFQKLYDYYGSYPLAVAAYNAGQGNVNKWLRANGDPRAGGVDMIDWIEQIPIFETRNYVQRVLENAVVYDLMNPAYARSHGPANLSWFLGKSRAG